MTVHRGTDYNPYLPQDLDVRRAFEDLVGQLNRLNRNEFTVVVPCGDILPEFSTLIPDELPATWKRTILRTGYAPSFPGLVLRRARLVKGESVSKTPLTTRGVKVRALVQIGEQAIPVGEFSTYEWALDRGFARRITGEKDIDKPVPPNSPVVCETTYSVWPRLPFVDAAVLFDFGYAV